MAATLTDRLAQRIGALVEVIDSELAEVTEVRPDRLDLQALAGSGRPWTALGEVAVQLVRAETDLAFLAYEVIEPDPDLEWRLFHLSVLGASASRAAG